MLEDGRHVDQLFHSWLFPHRFGEELEEREVLFDQVLRIGPLDLDNDFLATRQRGAVDLGYCAGGEGARVDGFKNVLPRNAEILLHHTDDLLLGKRGDVVPKLCEFLDELRWEQVRPG